MISNNFSIAMMVSDAKKSAKWYEEKLGFETSIEDHWVTAWPKGAGWKLHLCQGKPEPGNTGIGFYSDDVKKTAADLKKNGVKFARDYAKTEWGENAQIEDPDGNIIWIKNGSP
jgi:CreA protein